MVSIPGKSDELHEVCVIVDARLGQIFVTGCEVGIVLFTQTMPAIKLYPVQVFVSNKKGLRVV